jgi:hypothetical protein
MLTGAGGPCPSGTAGHKTMAMTLRYAKTTPTQLRDAIEALNSPNDSRQQEQG